MLHLFKVYFNPCGHTVDDTADGGTVTFTESGESKYLSDCIHSLSLSRRTLHSAVESHRDCAKLLFIYISNHSLLSATSATDALQKSISACGLILS